MLKKLFRRTEAPPPPRPKPFNNLEDARKRHPLETGVPSPCISVCQMDAASQECKGCYRSIEEIASWSRLSEAQRLAVWARIEDRQIASGQY